jgi:FKBP-type peptidyl-prolyl cis-trans isomerases 2
MLAPDGVFGDGPWMQITAGKVVLFDFVLRDADQEVIEDSSESGPLAFIQGAGQVVPGLEAAMEGRRAGEEFTVVVQPEDGYGLIDQDAIQVISREQVEGEDFEVGAMLITQGEDGEPAPVFVKRIEGDEITIDGNHPLAGEELHFSVTIRDVRDATPEELSHGHAHGEGGAEH